MAAGDGCILATDWRVNLLMVRCGSKKMRKTIQVARNGDRKYYVRAGHTNEFVNFGLLSEVVLVHVF